MTDNISTNFSYMGFNALSNSEYAYNVDQTEELTDPKYALGDSISLACTSTKLLRSVNGLKNIDITPTTNAGANLLATITGVAMSPNNTALVVGTNPAGVTTAPILYSPNGINFRKSATELAINARCVTYYNYLHSFLVGCTATVAGNAVVVCTQQGVAASGAVTTAFPAIGDRCNAISTSSKGNSAGATSIAGLAGIILYGGQFVGNNVAFGFSNDRVDAGVLFDDGTAPAGVGSINAISNDDGILDSSFVYTLAGGSYTAGGAGSNLVYNFRAVGANPGNGNTWIATANFDTIFPVGVNNSQVNAIAFNGQYFLVGGLGTVAPAVTNTCTVAIATFTIGAISSPATQGTIDIAIPTGCNIATLMSNVRSLEWNGLYWIAGGDNANGFVYARSIDAATWTLIGGAITGATSGLSVSSRFTPQ